MISLIKLKGCVLDSRIFIRTNPGKYPEHRTHFGQSRVSWTPDDQNTFKTKNLSSVSILLAMNFVARSMCSIISGIQNKFSIFLTKIFLVSILAKANVHRWWFAQKSEKFDKCRFRSQKKNGHSWSYFYFREVTWMS